MLTLTDFLLARIAEDEKAAGGVQVAYLDDWSGVLTERRHSLAARVLAECEAKRRIVEDALRARQECGSAPVAERVSESDGRFTGYWRGLDRACRVLAIPYADHADYREEWKP